MNEGNGRWRRIASCFWLTALVHADGLRLSPKTYARALLWRARGLRLRSRNTLAGVFAQSRYSYPLWILKREAAEQVAREPSPAPATKQMLAVIEYRADEAMLDRTLRSLAANGIDRALILLLQGQAPPVLTGPVKNMAISTCSSVEAFQAALPQLEESWLLPMVSGDCLSPHAIARYREVMLQDDVHLVYSDDDSLDAAGRRHAPYFKPGWNEELFRYQDFICFACAVRVAPRLDTIRWEAGEWARSLVNAALAAGPRDPVHIPAILHHRLERGAAAPLSSSPSLANGTPAVTIIVPTRNHLDLLRTCIEGLRQTKYANFDCLVVDNESDDPATLNYLESMEDEKFSCLKHPGKFNYSEINNRAVRHARGEYICFLNNDIEIIDRDWLGHLVSQATRPGVGAVGAKLLYPDRTIQHAGIVIGIGGAAGHAHRFVADAAGGYFDRHHLPQRVSAVTGACLIVRKSHFEEVGGFDEVDFPVAFNDVDLCLKLAAAGFMNIYEPRATLIHHESRSRGSDLLKKNRDRFKNELNNLKMKWKTDSFQDPWHNINLSRFTEKFLIDIL